MPIFRQQKKSVNPDTQRALAEVLSQNGVGGAVRTPLEGIGKLANTLTAAFLNKRADTADRERRDAKNEALQGALSGFRENPDFGGLVEALSGNPDTAGLATQLQLDDIGARRKAELDPRADNKTSDIRNFEFGQNLPEQDKLKFFNIASTTPSSVEEFNFFNTLSPEDQQRFLAVKRNPQFLNLGDRFARPDINNPGDSVSEFTRQLPPEQLPETKGKQTTAIEEAKDEVEKPKLKVKASSALSSFKSQAKIVADNIDKALALINPVTTGAGSLLQDIPATEARTLRNHLDTIKANVGFDKLQTLRDNSPTGGALGQVSDLENRLLQATSGALDQAQGKQLKENLEIIKQSYLDLIKEKDGAFAQDFGVPFDSEPSPENETKEQLRDRLRQEVLGQ